MLFFLLINVKMPTIVGSFSFPGQSPGRAVVLPLAAALAKCYIFFIKVFYVMGKALSGKLSCPCDRSCYIYELEKIHAHLS